MSLNSQMSPLPNAEAPHFTKRVLTTLWVFRGLLALVFLFAGSMKLAGQGRVVAEFQVIGFGQWLRYLTGTLEMLGAVLILTPRACGLGSLLLSCIMVGATFAELVRLHGVPILPLVFLLLAGSVTWFYRAQLWRIAGFLWQRRQSSVSAHSTPAHPTRKRPTGGSL